MRKRPASIPRADDERSKTGLGPDNVFLAKKKGSMVKLGSKMVECMRAVYKRLGKRSGGHGHGHEHEPGPSTRLGGGKIRRRWPEYVCIVRRIM